MCCTQVDSLLVPYFFVSPSIRWRTAAGVDVNVDGLLTILSEATPVEGTLFKFHRR